MPTKRPKPLVWQPRFYRSVNVAERAAQRTADVFGCRVVVREKYLDDGDQRGLYGVWREDIEATKEEQDWFERHHWTVLFVEDGREYNEDGKLKSEKEDK